VVQLQAAFDLSSNGLAMFDARRRLYRHNERFAELMSIPPALLLGGAILLDNLVRHFHARGDCPDLSAAEAVDRFAAYVDGTIPVRFEHGTAHGKVLEVNAIPLPEGGMLLSCNDITEHKAVEARLAAEMNQQQSLLEAIPDLVWMKTNRGAYVRCNPAFEKFIGAREAEIVGKGDYDFLSPEVAHSFRQQDIKTVSTGRAIVSEEWLKFRCDGQSALFETTRTPIRDGKGQIIGLVGIAHDITERHRMADQVQALALHDVLTKLPNRRLLYDHLKQAFAACKRWGHFSTLMLIDLDGFKQINDQHGHIVGDLLLVEASARLRQCVRDTDTVARYGGDEFVALVDDLAADMVGAARAAALVAEKIRTALGETYLLPGPKPNADGERTIALQCTASIGVAMINGHEEAIDDVIRYADAAMYRAKGSGRNCVRFLDGGG
jgi:diguanylate cyclase (GGDEF)-like protein/PAS domain S-box-containing protein